jgi:DNA segregation ATPase FtsK/SpoIIIE, S-DNA-T family
MRFPIFALIAPVVTSLVLWLITGSSYMLLFALLGPVMAVAQYVDGKFHARREDIHRAARAEEEELAHAQQSQLAAFATRADLLLRYPSSSFFADPAHTVRPPWAAHAEPAGAERTIRLGLARRGGHPVMLDITAGVAVMGEPVEVNSVLRSISFQLTWMWGAHEVTRVSLDMGQEPELKSLISASSPTSENVHRVAADGVIAAGARYLLSINLGQATLTDTVDATVFPIEMEVDLLSRAEAGLIIAQLLQERSALVPELTVSPLPEHTPAVLSSGGSWESPQHSLVVNVGRQREHPLLLDLVASGPHAVVTGMTGSGKTEFLTTWLVAMAACYRPDELSVLVIDFKGGAGFASLARLPHVVGVVTDLDHLEAHRAVNSLQAEVRFRERVLAGASVGDMTELGPGVLSRLVVVVDEYRAVLEAFPEFLTSFIDLASRGRALGIHLILSSQRVGGSLGDALLSNCALRVGFRVSQKQDSLALLGSDDAFVLPHIPGRAMIAGTSLSLREFQSARVSSSDLEEVQERASSWLEEHPHFQLRPVWLPPLPASIPAALTPKTIPGVAWLGLADLPEHQVQSWLNYTPSREGNLLVTGPARSGVSSALRAIAGQCDLGVITTAEQAWDVVVGATVQPEGAALVLDDLDSLLDEFDGEHRDEFVTALIRFSRKAPQQGRAVLLGCSEHVRGVSALLALFPSSLTLRSAHKPGRGLWNEHELQVLLPEQGVAVEALISEPCLELALNQNYAIVTTRKVSVSTALSARHCVGMVDISSGLTVSSAGGSQILIGTPDEWMSQPTLWASARTSATLVLDECTTSQLRGLRVSSTLLPHVGHGKALVVEPDGSTTRAVLL